MSNPSDQGSLPPEVERGPLPDPEQDKPGGRHDPRPARARRPQDMRDEENEDDEDEEPGADSSSD